jgi:hypothetical protein
MIVHREIDYSSDIKAIKELLNSKFEGDFDQSHFIWKHLDNPFGKSLGLVALDGGKIVGVRMFMKWQFKKGNDTVFALRPVDTITHPDYRGRGIFKVLTLKGLKKFRKEYDIIFNTPNQNSLPGYLKMGWKLLDKRPHYKLAYVISSKKRKISLECLRPNDVSINEKDADPGKGYYWTVPSMDFITWRYAHYIYKIAKIGIKEHEVHVIFRKGCKYGRAILIIEEIFGNEEYFKKAVRLLASTMRVRLVYYLSSNPFDFILSIKRGKAVIVYNKDEKNVGNRLFFSMGDLDARL